MLFSMILAVVAAAAEPMTLEGSNKSHTFACAAGQAVLINGSNVTATLTGDCGAVTVSGNTNSINADGVSSVKITGSNNTFIYARNLSGKKKLPATLIGVGNTVTK